MNNNEEIKGMKKIVLLVFILITNLSGRAQSDGFFKKGINDNIYDRDISNVPSVVGTPSLPEFGGGNQEAEAPLGTGIFLLTALGAGYAISKRRKEER